MTTMPTIKIPNETSTTVQFKLNTESASNPSDAKVSFIVEDVFDECGIKIDAIHLMDDRWAVVIPSLKQFEGQEWTGHLEVIIEGRHFTPVECVIQMVSEPTAEFISTDSIVETANVNAGSNTAFDNPVNNQTLEPEYPIETKLRYPVGQNTDDDIKADNEDNEDIKADNEDENKETIQSIASRVVGTEGPQLPYETTVYDAKQEAARIIEGILPVIKHKPETKGRLFDKNTKARLVKDPVYMAEVEEKARKVRDILGSI
jgi:hypothetical protein